MTAFLSPEVASVDAGAAAGLLARSPVHVDPTPSVTMLAGVDHWPQNLDLFSSLWGAVLSAANLVQISAQNLSQILKVCTKQTQKGAYLQ